MRDRLLATNDEDFAGELDKATQILGPSMADFDAIRMVGASGLIDANGDIGSRGAIGENGLIGARGAIGENGLTLDD